jgi:FkbM family methyltransferase
VTEDLLLVLHRRLQGVVDALHVRPLARAVFRSFASVRYKADVLATARQNGRVWKLDPSVALRGTVQELDTIEWLRRVLREGDTAIDVGANVGQMTLEMAALVGPLGTVVAVEPGSGNVRCLRRHVTENGFEERVRIIEAACMDCDGGEAILRTFTKSGSPDEVASGHDVGGRAVHKELKRRDVIVPKVSIDGMVARLDLRPRAIKVDVEGAELAVLAGATETLMRHKPLLRVAFHPFAFEDGNEASEVLRNQLAGGDYRIADDPGGSLALSEYDAAPPPGS